MKNEKSKENGCRIFCIYLDSPWIRDDDIYDILQKVARYGNTEHLFKCESLDKFYHQFHQIYSSIQINN